MTDRKTTTLGWLTLALVGAKIVGPHFGLAISDSDFNLALGALTSALGIAAADSAKK